MLDEELIEMLTPTLPENIPYVFISSVANIGIQQLKDILWEELNKDSNRLEDFVRRLLCIVQKMLLSFSRN